ncbi:hypothetical protein PGB90_005506 [Kerria lacca]
MLKWAGGFRIITLFSNDFSTTFTIVYNQRWFLIFSGNEWNQTFCHIIFEDRCFCPTLFDFLMAAYTVSRCSNTHESATCPTR